MTITRKLSPIIGFHGCDRSVAENVLAGNSHLSASENTYDWLGSGIYFWVDSFARAYDWAKSRKNSISEPYVIGAVLDPGHCLDLTDYGVAPLLTFFTKCRLRMRSRHLIQLMGSLKKESRFFPRPHSRKSLISRLLLETLR